MEKSFKPSISTAARPIGLELGGLPQGLIEFFRYGLISALALAVDFGLLLLLRQLEVGLVWAAGFAFLAGLLLVYGLSVRWVFARRRLVDHRAEFLIFASVGLAGLLITEALLHWLSLQLSLGTAKLLTSGVVFLFNFSLRKLLLFTRKN